MVQKDCNYPILLVDVLYSQIDMVIGKGLLDSYMPTAILFCLPEKASFVTQNWYFQRKIERIQKERTQKEFSSQFYVEYCSNSMVSWPFARVYVALDSTIEGRSAV